MNVIVVKFFFNLVDQFGEELFHIKDSDQPINLRQKTIGTLQLHASREATPWNKDDLAVIETIMDQVAQTAENLRLFEETRQQAAQEQTIREITDKLRAAPNLHTLTKVASQELGKVLGASVGRVKLGLSEPLETPPRQWIARGLRR